jgi:hypothetical protein
MLPMTIPPIVPQPDNVKASNSEQMTVTLVEEAAQSIDSPLFSNPSREMPGTLSQQDAAS